MAAWDQPLRHIKRTRDHTSGLYSPADLPTGPPYVLRPGIPSPGLPIPLRHPIAQTDYGGTGILTCFPSTTPFGLSLGTDSPKADCPCLGNLGLTANGVLIRFIATRAGIVSSVRHQQSSRSASYLAQNAPLPSCTPKSTQSAASVNSLSPVELSAQGRSTSELLRFL